MLLTDNYILQVPDMQEAVEAAFGQWTRDRGPEVTAALLSVHSELPNLHLSCPNCAVLGTNTTTPYYQGPIPYVYCSDPKELHSLTSVSELVVGMIVAVHRNMFEASKLASRYYTMPPAKPLSQSNLLVIGYGRIGHDIVWQCSSMFRDIKVLDKNIPHALVMKHVENADVVVIAASANKKPIVDERFLQAMKHDSILVSVGDDGNVDYEELSYACDHWLRGAAVDTERPILAKSNRLLQLPHIGGSTIYSWQYTIQLTIQKMKKVLG